MKIKTKSNLLIAILTLATIVGIFYFVIGTATANNDYFIFDPETKTWTVYPTGIDDTNNIQCAFDQAVITGPGSTVQLASGQFFTNNIFVQNFYGTFKGAGIGLTKIDVLRALDPEAQGVIPYGDIETGQMTALFTFDGGDIFISDLSFDITPYTPAEQWYLPHPIIIDWHEDLTTIIWITGEINSRIERVICKGHEGTFSPFGFGSWNVRTGIAYSGIMHAEKIDSEIPYYVEPGFTGNHDVINCEFDSVGRGIFVWGLTNGKFNIAANTFEGIYYAITMWDIVKSKFEISYNNIECRFFQGIYVYQLFQPRYPEDPEFPLIQESSHWQITNNYLYISDIAEGIIIIDRGVKPLEVVIVHNTIILETYIYGYSGIGLYSVQNALISNNNFILETSYSGIGIYLNSVQNALIYKNNFNGIGLCGIECMWSNDNKIILNDMKNLEVNWVHIVLVYSSKKNVIVGDSTKPTVLDDTDNPLTPEYDGDNILIRVTIV